MPCLPSSRHRKKLLSTNEYLNKSRWAVLDAITWPGQGSSTSQQVPQSPGNLAGAFLRIAWHSFAIGKVPSESTMPPCAPRVIESFRHAHSHVTKQARVPIEVWTLELEHEALAKLLNVSQLPIVQHHVPPCRTCMRGLVAPWLGDSLCRCQHGYRCGMNALRLCCRPLICRIIWHITSTLTKPPGSGGPDYLKNLF